MPFRLHVTGDLNHKMSGSFLRALAALSNEYVLRFNSYQLECFLKQWICLDMRHWIWISIWWTIPIWKQFQANSKSSNSG